MQKEEQQKLFKFNPIYYNFESANKYVRPIDVNIDNDKLQDNKNDENNITTK